MFEAAVPAWRAKGNHSLRRTFAAKRRRTLQGAEEDELDAEDDEGDESDDKEDDDGIVGEGGHARYHERDTDMDTSSDEDDEEDQDENRPINLAPATTPGSRRRHASTEAVVSRAPRPHRQPLAPLTGARAAQPAQVRAGRRISRGVAQASTPSRNHNENGEASGSGRTSTQRPAKRPRVSGADAQEVIEIKDEPEDVAAPPAPQRPTPRPTPDAGPSRPARAVTPPAPAVAADECAPGCRTCREKGYLEISDARLRRMLHEAESRAAALASENENLRTRLADKDKIIALHERILGNGQKETD